MIIFESTFPKDFRSAEIKKILSYATTGKFCQLICVPGAGKATILRLLAHNRELIKFHINEKANSTRFVYINLLDLENFDEAQIAKFLLIALDQTPKPDADSLMLAKQFTETINDIANKNESVVLLFDHFDQYQKRLPRMFYQLLKNSNSMAKYKFSVIFATRRDLTELIDVDIVNSYWDFFVGNTLYLKIYNEQATEYLFTQLEKLFSKKLSTEDRSKIISLTGGHAKLTKILTELALGQKIELTSEHILQNNQIRSTLYELWFCLTSVEQHQLAEYAKNSKSGDFMDEYLIKLDLITKTDKNSTAFYKFTIPIFGEFTKTMLPEANYQIEYNPQTREILKGNNIISELLTAQEFRLLSFLVQNPEKLLERDEIISQVWPDSKNTEAISDEAIDQMVFRIRKKIEDEPSTPKHILTIKGRGLKFEP